MDSDDFDLDTCSPRRLAWVLKSDEFDDFTAREISEEVSHRHDLIFYLAENNDAKLLEVLLRGGFQPDLKDQDGRTPLSHAAEQGHSEVVMALLDKGAQKDQKDKFGCTPVWYAKKMKRPLVTLILRSWRQKHEADLSNKMLQTAGNKKRGDMEKAIRKFQKRVEGLEASR